MKLGKTNKSFVNFGIITCILAHSNLFLWCSLKWMHDFNMNPVLYILSQYYQILN